MLRPIASAWLVPLCVLLVAVLWAPDAAAQYFQQKAGFPANDWMSLSLIVLNTAPKLPTRPACSQWEISLFRTMWWPMLSFDQPFSSARSMVLT